MLTREPAVAGTFYPADPDELYQTVNELLKKSQAKNASPFSIKAIIVPHAGYIYSGELAAQAYASLRDQKDKIKTLVLLGPAHKVHFRGIAAPDANEFKTPLGSVPVDQNAIENLIEKFPFVQRIPQAHRDEHSLEVQLPFLQGLLPDFSLIPLVVGDSLPDQVDKIVDFLWGNESTLIVISTDLSHFHSYTEAQTMDSQTADAIESLQPQGLNGDMACGYLPVSGLLLSARRRQMWPQRVGLCNSGDAAGDKSRVVGYGAWLFRQQADFKEVISGEQKEGLKNLALASIHHGIAAGEPLSLNDFNDQHASLKRLQNYQAAAFVTLKLDGQLRGCIGSLSAYRPLVEDVSENAFAAAFRDPRFNGLTEQELENIEISISVLTAPQLMVFTSEQDLVSQLRPNVDGMILTEGKSRGTFLPSVWEHYPEPESFLTHLKLKAGLPTEYWSGTVKVERYQTTSW